MARLKSYPDTIRNKAEKLLLEGDPQKFIQNTFQKMHVGDKVLVETLPVCAASTFITGKNSGLPIKITGYSGKGKSSGSDSFLELVPSYMVIKGGLSDKYLYYAEDLQAGSICFVDDKELSPSLQELVKNSITNFQNPEHYRTVINGEPVDLTAPARTAWIFASVDGFDEEQMSNRFLQAEIDSSEEQDHCVAQFQRKSEIENISTTFQDDVEVCRCIYDLLGLRTYDIRIPFAEAIIWNHEHNRRNQLKFFDIIRAVCLYKVHQRDQVNGYYLAIVEDYKKACEIYKQTTVQNNSNLTASEQKVICSFVQENMAKGFYKDPKPENAIRLTYEQLEALTGIKKAYLKKLINGKNSQSLGLGGKVIGLGSETSGDGKQKKLFYYTGAASFEIYEQFSSLASEDLIEATISKSLKALLQATNKEDKIVKEIFWELADELPSLPAVTQAIPSQKVSSTQDVNDSSITNNTMKKSIVTLKKENDPESENFPVSPEVKKCENLEKNEEKNICFTLNPQNQGNDLKIEPLDAQMLDPSSKVTKGNKSNDALLDNETLLVTGIGDTMNLEVHTRKIQEYIDKECHGNHVTKSVDDHITAFKKYCPEFRQVDRCHLEYAFNKVLKSTPTLDKIPGRNVGPLAVKKKSKGIEILEKALKVEKEEEIEV